MKNKDEAEEMLDDDKNTEILRQEMDKEDDENKDVSNYMDREFDKIDKNEVEEKKS